MEILGNLTYRQYINKGGDGVIQIPKFNEYEFFIVGGVIQRDSKEVPMKDDINITLLKDRHILENK